MLAQPASDPHDRAIRWRQLVELAARAGSGADRELVVAEALARIRADSETIDERVRIAAALAIAPLALPVELIAIFASDRIAVAAPVLASAKLTASEWKAVAESASDDCRTFIANMRSEAPSTAPPAPAAQREPEAIPSIREVVARIERLRQAREAGGPEAAQAGTSAQEPRLFRWECNESGEIEWVEGAPRGALVGQSIAQAGLGGGVDRRVERAFAARAPFHEGVLELNRGGTVGGTWKISGVPAFEPASGRFAGYRGMAIRSNGNGGAAVKPTEGADSLRELAHEIKTPLNAIIGFAEIISGEYLGPAESRYRERAREIVEQARLLLTAVEDVDLAARLRSPLAPEAERTDLGTIVERVIARIRDEGAARGVAIEASRSTADLAVAVQPEIAERLILRLCSAVIAGAMQGERLRLTVDSEPDHSTLSISKPDSLRGADLTPERNRRSSDAGTLPLRLVMGLARTAGGELDCAADALRLRLPKR